MYRRNREFGITKTNHIVLVTSLGQTVSSVFRCLSIAGKPYSVSLVCCCSQWRPILFFKSILQLELVRVEVLPHYQFNASDKLSDEMTQMQSMMHVIHSELHFCYANFSYAVQGHLGDVSLASPGHFLELMSALKKVEVWAVLFFSGISTIGQRQKRVQWKLVAAIPIFDTYVAHVVLTILGLPLGMFFDSSTPCFSQVELASCSASCRSPWVEVCTPRVGKSSPRNELLSAPIGRRNSSKWHFAPWTDMVSFSKSLEFLNLNVKWCQMV